MHLLLTVPIARAATASSSSQVTLRHPEDSPYRCFLPDLTGFEGSRRAEPDYRRRPRRNTENERASRRSSAPLQRIAGTGHR